MSAAQDVEAGDGTTSVVVIAGALLGAAEMLLSKGKYSFGIYIYSAAHEEARNTPHDYCGVFPESGYRSC